VALLNPAAILMVLSMNLMWFLPLIVTSVISMSAFNYVNLHAHDMEVKKSFGAKLYRSRKREQALVA
jgi:hypothetical protein